MMVAYEALKIRADTEAALNPLSKDPLWARFGENRAKARAKEAAERGGTDDAALTAALKLGLAHPGALQAVEEAMRGGGNQPSASTGATRAAAPKVAAPAMPTYSQATADKAVAKARAEERQRIRTVFASEASKGRERLAATLLAAPEGWAAADIIAKLPQVDASMKAKGRAKIDAMWERANAKVHGQPATAKANAGKAEPARSAGASVWDRAYAKIDTAWDRARAKAGAGQMGV